MADRPSGRSRQRSGNPAVRRGSAPPRTRTPQAPAPRPAAPQPVETWSGLLPADGAPYPLVLRNTESSWKTGLLGPFFGLALYVVLVMVVSRATIRVGWIVSHPVDYLTYYNQALAFARPIGMLGANLGIMALIPIALVLTLVVHRVRPRWIFSVLPGIRWRFLLLCLVPGLLVFGALTVVPALVTGWTGLRPQPGLLGFLLVVVLTSPFQAAAEEIFFRGYLLTALGSVTSRAWFGVVTSAVLFALLHGTQNLALFVNRLAFGLIFAAMTWLVGGIEAGIAVHVANNLVSYLWASLTTSIAALAAVRTVTWADSGLQILGFVLCAALVWGIARLARLRNRVDLGAAGVTT